jgi:hypothetical protein
MPGKRLSLEEHLQEVESHELNEREFQDLSEDFLGLDKNTLENADIVRIEEDVPFYWSGVSGCNDNTRAQNEYLKTRNEWAKNKIFEYRQWRWVKFGALSANGRCRQSQDPWTNVRKCSCSGTLKCFIEFIKP